LLCWRDTALLGNAVQKVKATLLELFDTPGKRAEWVLKA
jgi:LysR family nitrogen assimilation transcriptional regulator